MASPLPTGVSSEAPSVDCSVEIVTVADVHLSSRTDSVDATQNQSHLSSDPSSLSDSVDATQNQLHFLTSGFRVDGEVSHPRRQPRNLTIKDSGLHEISEQREQPKLTELQPLVKTSTTDTNTTCDSHIFNSVPIFGAVKDKQNEECGSGSTLKNRLKGEGTTRNMPSITEEDKVPSCREYDNGSHLQSQTTSYSSTYSSVEPTVRKLPQLDKLTVNRMWKVESMFKMKQKMRSSGIVITVIKWAITVAMATLLTSCLVTSKLAIVVLSKKLNNVRPNSSSTEDWKPYFAQSALMYLYLEVPVMLMLLRSAWYGLRDKTVPWPCRKAVFVTILSAFLESLGLSLLGMSVLGRFRPSISLLMMSSLVLLPALFNIRLVWKLRKQGLVGARTVPCVLTGFIFVGFGLMLTVLAVFDAKELNSSIWRFAVAFVCLSVAWMPSVQQYTTTTNCTQPHGPVQEHTNTTYGTTGGYENCASRNWIPLGDSSSKSFNENSQDRGSNAAWKTSFISNLCRLVFFLLVFFVLLITDVQSVREAWSNLSAFKDALNDLNIYLKDISSWIAFGMGLSAGFLAYCVAVVSCHMNMAMGTFALPLLLTTPVCMVFVEVEFFCDHLLGNVCNFDRHLYYVLPAAICFFFGHLLAFGWNLFRQDSTLLLQESLIFFEPSYNCVTLDTWLTLNRRCSEGSTGREKIKKTKVYICTTMYREEEEEMRQLLNSIRLINEAQAMGEHCFESHIIFDSGVRQRELTDYALVLISLLNDTLAIDAKMCTKVVTPYGLKLSWALPGRSGKQMAFSIHLKDNLLVKSKKRWSQVMYMSYVLDFLAPDEEDTFILTTDADVVFSPESVGALMDLMKRDKSIGAVCARTHPMGNGPLVWYQVFEYAIGHWFQKVLFFHYLFQSYLANYHKL